MKGNYFFIISICVVAIFLLAKYFYFKPGYDSGQQAPDFSSTLISGERFSLSDLRDNYILLDFWGSWCGPCRVENPHLVELYNEFHNQSFNNAENFEIVSVAIETNEARWRHAIIRDKLSWKYHLGEFQRFKSPIAQMYGVREVPTKYLIGPEGNIIAVNPDFKTIRQTLESLIR
jgi:thiol-disulfide isomerase/thioredoxin